MDAFQSADEAKVLVSSVNPSELLTEIRRRLDHLHWRHNWHARRPAGILSFHLLFMSTVQGFKTVGISQRAPVFNGDAEV